MKLYIMRHGPAEDTAASGRDFDRALTDPGRHRVRSVAHALEQAGESPRTILSSPLVRARQTAELVAPIATDSQQVEIDHALAPGGDGAGLALRLLGSGRRRVMLVGHEPDLSGLVEQLTAFDFLRDMQKGMVVALKMTAGHPAELRFVLDPKTLEMVRQ